METPPGIPAHSQAHGARTVFIDEGSLCVFGSNPPRRPFQTGTCQWAKIGCFLGGTVSSSGAQLVANAARAGAQSDTVFGGAGCLQDVVRYTMCCKMKMCNAQKNAIEDQTILDEY